MNTLNIYSIKSNKHYSTSDGVILLGAVFQNAGYTLSDLREVVKTENSGWCSVQQLNGVTL